MQLKQTILAIVLSGIFWNSYSMSDSMVSHAAVILKKSEIPLLEAIENGSEAAVLRLIENGANVNQRISYCYEVPLHWAAKHGQPSIVRILLLKGARPNPVNDNGETPLCFATKKAKLECFRATAHVLLEGGANVNVEDKMGLTPLMYAVRAGGLDMIMAFLLAGAQVNAKNDWGWTALDMANKEYNQKEYLGESWQERQKRMDLYAIIVNILVRAGARSGKDLKSNY